MITEHAVIRMQQRGFRRLHIEFILKHGKKIRFGDAMRYVMTKKILKTLISTDYSIDVLEKCSGSYVVANGDTVITVAHIY